MLHLINIIINLILFKTQFIILLQVQLQNIKYSDERMQKKIFALNLLIFLSCFWLTSSIQTTQETRQNNNYSKVDIVKQAIQQQPNSDIIEKGGQWRDIQKSQNDFNWDMIDLFYSKAQKNKLDVKWIIAIDSQNFPQWTKNMSVEQMDRTLLNFFSKICQRYENFKQFILKVSNQTERIGFASEISKHCGKRNFIIDKKVDTNKKVIQQENDPRANQYQNRIKNGNSSSRYEKGSEKMVSGRLLSSSDPLPVASFTIQTKNLFLGVDATASTSASQITKYIWTWGDGSNEQQVTTAVKSHTYTKEGIYLVTLRVGNSNGAISKMLEKAITVQAVKPTKLVKAWKEEINVISKASSNIIVSKFISNDGTIKTKRYFSKT